jgi:hypothetical protein
MQIFNGSLETVSYAVQGGSPQLQRAYRLLQYAEQEVSVVEQLQLLKLEYVHNERQLEALRTAQQLSYFMPRFTSGGDSFAGESTLKSAVSYGLADEATPERAEQIIRRLEQAQLDLAQELKNLPAKGQASQRGPGHLPTTRNALLKWKAASSTSKPVAPPQWATPRFDPTSVLLSRSPAWRAPKELQTERVTWLTVIQALQDHRVGVSVPAATSPTARVFSSRPIDSALAISK